MICRDLMSIDEIKEGLTLCAGEKGLGRRIRWLYFADCLECLDEDSNLLEWIHGGELIIVTNKTFVRHTEKLLDLMRLGKQKEVAGFIINIGQTPEKVLQYANEEDIPVFEIGFNLKMVDLSQILCLKLAEEIQGDTEIHQLFYSIMFPQGLTEKDIAFRAESNGVDLSGPHYVMAFDVDHLTQMIVSKKVTSEEREMILFSLLSCIRSEFHMNGVQKIIYLLRGDAVVLLVKEEQSPRKKIEQSIQRIQKDFHASTKKTVSVGIGSDYARINDFCNSMTEALQTIEVIHLYKVEEGIRKFENIGLYYIISQFENKTVLEEYANHLLGPLIESDRYSDGNLLETLRAYFSHDCNANATAESLYIHRNTMRYRLEKIEKLLGRDLNQLENFTELNLAFHIKNFLNSYS